jgi:hypothetical protein
MYSGIMTLDMRPLVDLFLLKTIAKGIAMARTMMMPTIDAYIQHFLRLPVFCRVKFDCIPAIVITFTGKENLHFCYMEVTERRVKKQFSNKAINFIQLQGPLLAQCFICIKAHCSFVFISQSTTQLSMGISCQSCLKFLRHADLFSLVKLTSGKSKELNFQFSVAVTRVVRH